LALFLVNKFASRIGKRIDGVGKETMGRLLAYAWPGNVRELENILERAVILASGPILEIDPNILSRAVPTAEACQDLTLEWIERDHIVKVLKQTKGVVDGPRGAAKILNLHPNTLRSRMKKLGISPKAQPHDIS
jgi:transcriptional regulator with GAF, ATPase, and Fis domain